MSIAAQLISKFGKQYKVTRQRKDGAYINGRWAPTGNLETLQITASVQPLSGDELQMLPEGERTAETKRLYTTTKLNSLNESEQMNADIITIDGSSWEVHKAEAWSPNILDHNKYLIVRMNRQE